MTTVDVYGYNTEYKRFVLSEKTQRRNTVVEEEFTSLMFDHCIDVFGRSNNMINASPTNVKILREIMKAHGLKLNWLGYKYHGKFMVEKPK